MEADLFIIAITLMIGGGLVFLVTWFASSSAKQQQQQNAPSSEEESTRNGTTSKSSSNSQNSSAKNKHAQKWKRDDGKNVTYSHPWLASNLKGHSGNVLDVDFSSNGKHLISSSEDRTLLLWNTKDFKGRDHKSVRGSVELDHAKLIRFAPDSKSLILTMSFGNKLAVYKLAKKEDTNNIRIEPVDGVEYSGNGPNDITHMGIACNGRFIMTASKNDSVSVWDLRGSLLNTINTKQNSLHHATVSPCGRFVASSGFTPDVLVWEVHFSRTGDYQEVKRAFELKGHSSGVYAFDFNQDSTRMVTASKDGTFKCWDTDVKYTHGQDPRLLMSGSLPKLKESGVTGDTVQLSMAPNGDTFAIVIGNSVQVYRWMEETEDGQMDNVHSTGAISSIRFSPDSMFLITAGDKHIRIFHNVSFYKAIVQNTPDIIKRTQGEAHKERLKEQMEESKLFIQSIASKDS